MASSCGVETNADVMPWASLPLRRVPVSRCSLVVLIYWYWVYLLFVHCQESAFSYSGDRLFACGIH